MLNAKSHIELEFCTKFRIMYNFQCRLILVHENWEPNFEKQLKLNNKIHETKNF